MISIVGFKNVYVLKEDAVDLIVGINNAFGSKGGGFRDQSL